MESAGGCPFAEILAPANDILLLINTITPPLVPPGIPLLVIPPPEPPNIEALLKLLVVIILPTY